MTAEDKPIITKESYVSVIREHRDKEIISKIEEMIAENKAKADNPENSGNKIFFYDTKVIALTELLTFIKEKK